MGALNFQLKLEELDKTNEAKVHHKDANGEILGPRLSSMLKHVITSSFQVPHLLLWDYSCHGWLVSPPWIKESNKQQLELENEIKEGVTELKNGRE